MTAEGRESGPRHFRGRKIPGKRRPDTCGARPSFRLEDVISCRWAAPPVSAPARRRPCDAAGGRRAFPPSRAGRCRRYPCARTSRVSRSSAPCMYLLWLMPPSPSVSMFSNSRSPMLTLSSSLRDFAVPVGVERCVSAPATGRSARRGAPPACSCRPCPRPACCSGVACHAPRRPFVLAQLAVAIGVGGIEFLDRDNRAARPGSRPGRSCRRLLVSSWARSGWPPAKAGADSSAAMAAAECRGHARFRSVNHRVSLHGMLWGAPEWTHSGMAGVPAVPADGIVLTR